MATQSAIALFELSTSHVQTSWRGKQIIDNSVQCGKSLVRALSGLRKDDSFCDVTLIVGSHKIRAHKLVLAALSWYFESLLESAPTQDEDEDLEINLTKFNGQVMEKIVEFGYSGHIQLTPSDVQEIFETAHFLQLNVITDECGTYFNAAINANNCCQIYRLASDTNSGLLCLNALKFCCANFSMVCESDAFLTIPGPDLIHILQQEQLCVVDGGFIPLPENQEHKILEHILRYVNAELHSRLAVLPSLLEAIRLPTLLPSACEKLSTNPIIKSSTEAMQLVKQALKLGPYYKVDPPCGDETAQASDEGSNSTQEHEKKWRMFRSNGALSTWLSCARGTYNRSVVYDSPGQYIQTVLTFDDRDLICAGACIAGFKMWFDCEVQLIALEIKYTSGHCRHHGANSKDIIPSPYHFTLDEGEVITEVVTTYTGSSEDSRTSYKINSLTFITSKPRTLGPYGKDGDISKRVSHPGQNPLQGYLCGIEGGCYYDDGNIMYIQYHWAYRTNEEDHCCHENNESDEQMSDDEYGEDAYQWISSSENSDSVYEYPGSTSMSEDEI